MPTFEEDYHWQDQFMPAICRLLAAAFAVPLTDVLPASLGEGDLHRNTDIYLRRAGKVRRVSSRMRRRQWLYRYRHQFTIRYSRPSVPTEWDKLVSGWGDYNFYGFDGGSLEPVEWFIGDLAIFRRWLRGFTDETPPCEIKPDKDGSASLVGFDLADMPTGYVMFTAKRPVHTCGWARVDGVWTCVQDHYAVGFAPETACGATWAAA